MLLFALGALLRLSAQSLDTTFGTGGYKIMNYPGSMSETPVRLQVMPDGRIVCFGQMHNTYPRAWFVMRLLPNGDPDPSFSDDGQLMVNPCTSDDYGTDMVMGTNGDLHLLGYEWWTDLEETDKSVVTHVTANGEQDMAYGNSAGFNYWLVADHVDTRGQVLALFPDGSANVLAQLYSTTYYEPFYRLLPNGLPDTTFADHGTRVVQPPVHLSVSPRDGCALPDHGMYMCGLVGTGINEPRYQGVVRLTAEGLPDSTFSGDGWVVEDFDGNGLTTARLIADHAGRALVFSRTTHPNGEEWGYLVRYLTDGTHDPTFANAGILAFPPGETLLLLAELPDERIAVLTAASGITGRYLRLLRPDGTWVQDFGVNGHFTIPNDLTAQVMAVQPDGAVLVGAGCSCPDFLPPDSFTNRLVFLRILVPPADLSTSVAPAPPAAGATLYPVPAQTTAQVALNGAHPVALALYDAAGRLLLQQVVAQGALSCSVDVHALPPGTYFLHLLEASNARRVLPLVVQR